MSQQIHVGDVGTVYRLPVLATDIPKDPAEATVMSMIFSLPDEVTIEKSLLGSPTFGQLANDGEPPRRYFFLYTVQTDDGAGSPPADFHAAAGPVQAQVHLEWADGTVWNSKVFGEEVDGLEFTILADLG